MIWRVRMSKSKTEHFSLCSYGYSLFWVFISLYISVQVVYAQQNIREYYISVEEYDWDYAPSGEDQLRGVPLQDSPMAALYTVSSSTRVGRVYHKARYRKYRDPEFKQAAEYDPSLGMLGPIIRAEAGDQVRIRFLNRASVPHSLHPHTVQNDILAWVPGAAVQPGETYEYVWDVPTTSPGGLWAYSSRADPLRDLHAGLIGPIVIYPNNTLHKQTPGSPERPRGIDQEIFALMMVTDEAFSPYFLSSTSQLQYRNDSDPAFLESNRMYHINGYVFNNHPGFHMYYGHTVRWYVLSLGLGDDDVHTAHWHGATLLHKGHRVDVVDLWPVSFTVLDMIPDNEGQWLFHCHVGKHFEAGMSAYYQVEKLDYSGKEGWDDDVDF
ncbi:Cupredoxin [Syncephalastrum racemosum]|uniref:Cupredoxin n=1 Tax=Syncephalastrum racemosum TaxID=13706 RepID=A0A1X2HDE4_SYNRA|nr:Cupredoxin [Syncephalastrum racemosum]